MRALDKVIETIALRRFPENSLDNKGTMGYLILIRIMKRRTNMLKKIRGRVAIIVTLVFALTIVLPSLAISDEAMDKKCAATKAGTETNEETKKECAAYFEQEKAAAAGAAGGAAVAGGVGGGTIAIGLGIAAAIGIAIAAGGGGGGGGGFVPPAHH
jgi:hypothetical protein